MPITRRDRGISLACSCGSLLQSANTAGMLRDVCCHLWPIINNAKAARELGSGCSLGFPQGCISAGALLSPGDGYGEAWKCCLKETVPTAIPPALSKHNNTTKSSIMGFLGDQSFTSYLTQNPPVIDTKCRDKRDRSCL